MQQAPSRVTFGREDREFVGLVTLSHALQHIFAAILPLTYPYVILQFHVSYAELGIVLGVTGITGGLMQGVAGQFERFSARILLTAQNAALALTMVGAALAPGFPAFGAARWAGSVVGSPQHPVGSGALASRYPERRGTVLSLHTTGGSLGTIAVPLLASLLIARAGPQGWRVALLVFALPLAAGALLIAARLRPAFATGSPDSAPPRRSLKEVLRSRNVVAILAGATIAAGGRGLGVINAYVPAYLKSGLGMPAVTVGLVFTVLLVGGLVGPVGAGYLADRLGRKRVVLAAYILGAGALAAFGAAGHDLAALLVLGALVGLFAYAESPLLQSLFADAVVGHRQQAAFGIFFAVAYGVGSLWSAAIGAIIDRAGFEAAFMVMALSFLAAAAAVSLVRPAPPTSSPQALDG